LNGGNKFCEGGLMRTALKFVIMGCGARGQTFAEWIARHPDQAHIVAVAEPDRAKRDLISDRHQVPQEMRFERWEDLLDQPRLADVVINTLMDRLHIASALKALELGYHMLLEKPMAVTLDDCIAIDDSRRDNDRIVSVCHSLRYHAVYREVKQLIDAGTIGKVVSIDQLEGVDPAHQAHSFVRGNWSRESESTFMLLAKSCHDIDVLVYLVGDLCSRVSSFGSLSYFNRANKPTGAPVRCSDGCPHEGDCSYSALRVYGKPEFWGQYIGLDRVDQAARDSFVKTSNYGLCVYEAGNDVVDHQVVNFEFAGGATGTFTMTAFAPHGRYLRVHGTHGYLTADIEARKIEFLQFNARAKPSAITIPPEGGGHGGGDDNVMHCLVRAIRENDSSLVLTGTEESLRTHVIAFAAEIARREKRVVELDELVRKSRIQIASWVRSHRREGTGQKAAQPLNLSVEI
jgi:predicted dehydrogenase